MADPKGPASRDAPQSIDPRLVRKLADILTDTGLTEIEVEQNGLKIRVARQLTAAPAPAALATVPVATAVAAPLAQPAAIEAPMRGEAVKSPMVGTIYLKPAPDADPFVKVGEAVAAGQTLLLVEAMKTMNPIAAPKAGVVLRILVEDAQPVEFGEPLLIIE